jgi:hypothetical protein
LTFQIRSKTDGSEPVIVRYYDVVIVDGETTFKPERVTLSYFVDEAKFLPRDSELAVNEAYFRALKKSKREGQLLSATCIRERFVPVGGDR